MDLHTNNKIVYKKEEPHPRYIEAREKAYQLESTIESAQKEYAKQLATIIKKLQQKFYSQYGDKIQELEDLEDGISHIQYKGMKNLKRQLTQLYLESDDNEQVGGGDNPLRQKTKELCETYKQQYMPKDNYQQKRDEEAKKLQMSIMGHLAGNIQGQGQGHGQGQGQGHGQVYSSNRIPILNEASSNYQSNHYKNENDLDLI